MNASLPDGGRVFPSPASIENPKSKIQNVSVGIVCGSGIALDSLLDERSDEVCFRDISELAPCVDQDHAALSGHERKFIIGKCAGHPTVIQCGRLHFYEGFDYETVTRPVDYMHSLGVTTVIFTCAAGGLKPGMRPGDLVAVERVRMWRCRKWPETPGMLFTDFLVPDCDFSGTYQWMHGPCYETPAEISAIQRLQAEAVGMSTAPELLRCQEIGMRGGIVAVITNSCCRPQILSHDQVVVAAAKASVRLASVIRRGLPAIISGDP